MTMAMEGITPWKPLTLNPAETTTPLAPAAPAAGEGGFQDLLMQGLEKINLEQANATSQVASFISGGGTPVHTVMLSLEQANLNLELAVQVRNKLLDAYNEIMRMQL